MEDNKILLKLSDIEKLTTLEAAKQALTEAGADYEILEGFKGVYTLLFADFGGYYGYSVLVYNNENKALYYCNNYELHYKHLKLDHAGLKETYINGLKSKIYTEAELTTPDFDYTSQQTKLHFLHNYYYANCDYITAFVVKGSDDEKQLNEKIKAGGLVYDPLGFCYVDDAEKVKAHIDLYKRTKAAFVKDSFEYWFNAFKYEMFNHEYAINWQGDFDVIECFSNNDIEYSDNAEKMLNQAGFSEIQLKAYKAARDYVLKHSDY